MAMAIKSPPYMQAWTLKSFFNHNGKAFVFVLASIPFLRLVWAGFAGDMGANPIEFITHSTGSWGLIFLCITLSVTPIRITTGWNWLLKYRRMLGLFCFFYAVLHFITWSVIDNGLDLSSIYQDFYKRTFITLGLFAFIGLIPLAITSTKGMQKRLGRNWSKLHELIYPIAILVCLHYYVHKAAKHNFGSVKIYLVLIGALLTWRLTRWLQKKYAIYKQTTQV
jgi:methionine sulfoxide reductase heme-binding subunit